MTRTEELTDLYNSEKESLPLRFTDNVVGEFEKPVFGKGNNASKLVFIGEAPGAEETVLEEPFVGKAGKQLDCLLDVASIPRNAVYVTNVVKYRPFSENNGRKRNRTPSAHEIKLSLPLLKRELDIIQPVLIATLGNTPLKAIELIYGLDTHTIGSVHGKHMSVREGLYLFPLYHPASVIYNHSLEKTLNDDIMLLGDLYKSMK